MATNNENLVKTSFVVSENSDAKKNGKTHEITIEYDFGGVTRSQLIAYALRGLQIAMQSEMRNLPTRKENPVKWSDVVKQYNGKKVNVLKDIVENSRSALTPEERAKRDIGKMSDATKAALLAELTKSLKK